MKRGFTRVLTVTMLCTLLMTGVATSAKAPVEIKLMTCAVGANPSAPHFESVKERFEEEYGDEIKLVIEEVPGMSNEMEDKLKILISANNMPDIVTAKTLETIKMAADANLIVDLKPYVEADPEWLASFNQDALAAVNPYEDKWYGLIDTQNVIGCFYNEAIFKEVGIEPAKTWDQFFENCDKIKAAGYIPLTLNGQEGGWLTNNALLPMVATHSQEGQAFISQKYPTNFTDESFVYGLTQIQRLYQDYASPDMVGNYYAASQPYFLRGDSAMIINGPWLITSIRDPEQTDPEVAEQIRFSLLPEDVGVLNLGDAYICGARTEETLDASLKLLKCFTDQEAQIRGLRLKQAPPLDASIDINAVEGLDPLFVEALNEVKNMKLGIQGPWTIFPNSMWEMLSREYSAMAFGQTTPEQMAQNLQDAALKRAD